jgi:hypothetical protein
MSVPASLPIKILSLADVPLKSSPAPAPILTLY